MHPLSQTLRRLFTRNTRPAGNRAHAKLVHEMMLELEDPPPSPLLLKIATGFPSALLCVLGAGALAGALAGREVSVSASRTVTAQAAGAAPAATVGSLAAVLAGRQAQLQQVEPQALSSNAPQPDATPPAGDTSQR